MSSFAASSSPTRNSNGNSGGGFMIDSGSGGGGGGGNKKAKIESNNFIANTGTTITAATAAAAADNNNKEFVKGKTITTSRSSSSGGWIFPDEEASIFESLRQYIQACPNVPRDHPAMKAALTGLDQEQSRRERDAKLKAKFSNQKKTNTSTMSSSTTEMTSAETSTTKTIASMKKDTGSVMKDAVTVERPEVDSKEESTSKEEEEVVDDWQDVTVARVDENAAAAEDTKNNNSLPSTSGGVVVDESSYQHQQQECSYMGKRLAQESITSLAKHQVRVKSPLAAIAVVLHAALRLPTVGMECTGLPENKNKSKKGGGGGGFAAPVRPLPKNVLMPPNWDTPDNANPIQFRYRKTGLGSVVLCVQSNPLEDESGSSSNPNINDLFNSANSNDGGRGVRVHVTLHPTRLMEPPSEILQFNLDDHMNMDSFQAAQSKTSRVEPALHYKALAGLLTAFVNSFDLGAFHDNDETNDGNGVGTDAPQVPLPYIDTSITMQPGTTTRPVFTANATTPNIRGPSMVQPPPQRPHQPPPQPSPYVFPGGGVPNPSTFPSPGGDFGNDLLPGGGGIPLSVGGFDRGNPMGGGNGMLMGPDHPIFSRTNPHPASTIPHPQFPGGGSLGPGWPQPRHDYYGPNGINGPTHPHGEPNPDHLRMPGGLGDGFDMQQQQNNWPGTLPPGARRWGGSGGGSGPGSRGNGSSGSSMNNMFL